MIGTALNVATVIVGGLIGMLLGGRLADRLRQSVVAALGLFTLGFGLQNFLTTENSLIVLGSLLVGVILGEALKIEEGLEKLGRALEARFSKPDDENGAENGQDGRFIRGFVTASLLFCVGPVAILGSIQDGLTGDIRTLVVKSVLDGFGALAFASTFGVGVLFSAAMILLYQGGITLLASQVNAFVTPAMMTEMNATGGVILVAIAISSILGIKKIRVGSFLPALFIAPLIVALVEMF